MTKREVIHRLRHDIREHSADSVLTNRHLWAAFWNAAKLLMQRAHDDSSLKDQSVFETFDIDTEEYNPFDGSCVPLDCIACRAKIPAPVTSKSGMIYSYIGSPDLHTQYAVVNPQEFAIKSKIKGTRQRYAFYENGYLHLSKCIPCLRVSMLPDVSVGNSCGVMDTVCPVPDYLIDAAIAISKENVAISKAYDHVADKNETT